jgi:hypothetical protein
MQSATQLHLSLAGTVRQQPTAPLHAVAAHQHAWPAWTKASNCLQELCRFMCTYPDTKFLDFCNVDLLQPLLTLLVINQSLFEVPASCALSSWCGGTNTPKVTLQAQSPAAAAHLAGACC